MTPAIIRRAAPLLVVGLAGCLATSGQVRRVQDETRTSRDQANANAATLRAQNDSIARATSAAIAVAFTQQNRLIQAQAQAQQAQTDSLHRFRVAFDAYRQQMIDTVRYMNNQIGIVRARTEAMATNNNALGARVEALTQQVASMTASRDSLIATIARLSAGQAGTSAGGVPTTDSTMTAEPPVSAAPAPSDTRGPNQLILAARDHIRLQSYSSARRALQTLVDTYAGDPLEPAGYLWMAQSYQEESNGAPPDRRSTLANSADSLYQLVATRFPKSPSAGLALFRRGLLVEPRNPTLARSLYTQVVSEYPNSEAAPLACDRLNRRNC